jgi:hypothetical protein
VWRYRIYGASGQSQQTGTYAFYELTFPRNFTLNSAASGTTVDWCNPVHENGNLLSYPAIPENGQPDDVNPFPYQVNGLAVPGLSDGLIAGNNSYCISPGITTSEQINMTGVTSATDELDWTRTNSWDNDAQIGDQVKGDEGIASFKASETFDLDLGGQQSWSQTTSSNNTLSGSQTFLLQQDQSTVPYTIAPFLYNSSAGVLKLSNYVDIPITGGSQSCSTNYWTQTYGGAPDPALNLPHRFNWTGYTKSTDTTTWEVNRTLEREKLRGFSINTFSAVENGYIPIGINPHEGDTVQLAVRVADFIEEDCAAFRQFEASQPPLQRTGKGALLVTEQFGSDEIAGNRRTIHTHKWT